MTKSSLCETERERDKESKRARVKETKSKRLHRQTERDKEVRCCFFLLVVLSLSQPSFWVVLFLSLSLFFLVTLPFSSYFGTVCFLLLLGGAVFLPSSPICGWCCIPLLPPSHLTSCSWVVLPSSALCGWCCRSPLLLNKIK